MAIFHFTVKIVGRSKGKSVISASAYLNGDVMKNEETGRISYYTSKKEVVYTSLMMCENAPPEWLHVPEENIKRFQQSIRYKRADDKDAALEKFKITFQKQRLWNEVLKIEKNADAQLGRSFEFSLPKEWSRQEQIDYTTEYIQKTFVDKGMCVDWSIHDKGDGNPHVHLLVTMRPFNLDHSWGNKEVKDWDFVRDTDGNIVVDESHPDWWQDKKNPDRHGIRIPVLDENGVQKVGARNRKQWKRVLTDATGWNNPKNCELWRSEWAGMCNRHLSIDNQIDHRSYERQGKLKIPTIHEGADARKIEEKYLTGQIWNGSWKVEENQMIKKQNALLQKVITTFGKVSGALSIWKEWLNDIRRKQRSNSHDGSNDYTDRGTAEYHGRDASGDTGKGREADVLSGAGRTIAAIRERIIRAASNLAGYRRTADASGRKDRPDTATYRRESAMAGISTEIKQREPAIAETEQRIADIEQQIEKARDIDDRIRKLKERRSTGRIATADGADAGRTRPERPDYRGTESAARRIADLEREVKQREQSREHSSLKERLEENKRIIAEREKKTHTAQAMIEECRDKQRQAEQERDYALSHQKKVEIPVEKPVLYQKCGNCKQTAYLKAKERYDTQREKLAGRYKAKTAIYEALMFLLIWYSVSTTLFQMIRSKIFISDCVVFFDTIATFIQNIAGLTILAGKNVAQVSNGISNPVVAGIIYWMIRILISGGCLVGVGILLAFIEIKIAGLYKKYCWDMITIMVILVSMAIAIYFADWIRTILPVNLLFLLLLVQVIYVVIRWYVKGWRETRGYY